MQSPAESRSRHLTVCDGVNVCASAIVQNIRCFGYRNLTLETSSPSSQSSAVASPGPAKCCAARDPVLPLPCSDLGQGVARSTTTFMLPRFFVQTHIFSVSPSSFSLCDREFLAHCSRFLAALKARLGLILAKAAAMRVMINATGCPAPASTVL